MLYSDYLPELSRHLSSSEAHPELGADQVSWKDLLDMELPSFQPAFLVLCRVLLNVIHECLKLRLEQRPAGEPSLLSIKQASWLLRLPDVSDVKRHCLCFYTVFVLCSWCASVRRFLKGVF